MLKKIFCLVLVSAQLLAQSLLEETFAGLADDVLFVSLGSTCHPAGILRNLHLRKEAHPFDWMLTIDGKKMIEILDTNFDYFLKEEFLKPHPTSGILLHKRYHIEFSREPNSFGALEFKHMDQLKERFTRKIERFKRIRNYSGKVFFIRESWDLSTNRNYNFPDAGNLEMSRGYASELFEALKRFFPKVDFDLVIINREDGKLTFEGGQIDEHIHMFYGDTDYESIMLTLLNSVK